MKAQITLTVPEAKRLIGKGIAAHPVVQQRLRKGTVVVCTGTTNGYVLEELLGERFDKRMYVTGKITAPGKKLSWPEEKRPDAVFRDGVLDPTLDRLTALPTMQAGDVYIKGANALNYERGLAGIWVAGQAAGTIGRAIGHIVRQSLYLLLPVSLEKCVPYPIEEAAALVNDADETAGDVVSLFPVHGHVFSEIEALRTLTGVEAVPCGAGGVSGAEGSTSLLIRGDAAAVRKAVELVEKLRGEPAFDAP